MWSSLIVQYDQPLTDAQLRATDVTVTLDGEAVARAWSLTEAADAVTAHQGGGPWSVTGTVTSVPSGTQDVTISGSVTLPVTVNNLPADYALPAAQVADLKTVTVSNPTPATETGLAKDATLAATNAALGSDGTTPPAILGGGTGVRGWLRSIYQQLTDSVAVTGTFWQDTQPVSAASLPLPAGAATAAKQLPDNHSVSVSNHPGDYPDLALLAEQDLLAKYRIADKESGATAYYGYLAPSGRWVVLREDKLTGAYRYANGGGAYPTAWTDRATLTYDYLDQLTGL